jgi:membrane protease YdiL (CAAX protease family)
VQTVVSFVRRYQIVLFFVLAFLISWIPWYTGGAGFIAAGVSVAGLIVAAVASGRSDVMEMVRHLLRWRVPLLWYLVALGLPLSIGFAAVGVGVLFGAAPPSFALLTTQLDLLPLFIVGAIFNPLAGPVGEEAFGWRGFAQPRLQALTGPVLTSLIIGSVWGIWHLPEFYRPGSSQYFMGLGFLIPFCFMEIAHSVVCTWVYNNTGGSTLVGGILVHASFNTTAGLTMLTSFDLDTGFFGMDTRFLGIQAIIMVAVALLIIVATHGRLGLEGSRMIGHGKPLPAGPPLERS